jgi:hypothetical protein
MVFLLTACNKDDEQPANEYLVDYSHILDYSEGTILSALENQMIIYPELSGIRDHVGYGVKIYKIQYKPVTGIQS